MVTLQLDRVTKTYEGSPSVRALRGVTLEVAAGDFVSVVGPSGSGKSTMLNLIGLLDRPTSGTYLIDGIDASALDERRRSEVRSAMFGFAFQSFHLLDRYTAVQNVELGLLYRGCSKYERHADAAQALERVGLAARLNHPAHKLSGGERQRVAIARALVAGAEVLVADEPTGNLDGATGRSIIALLQDLNAQGMTVVLVTHDEQVASAARRRIEMRDGLIAQSGLGVSAGVPLPLASASEVAGPRTRPSRVRARDFIGDAARAAGARPGRLVALVAAVAGAIGLVVATLGLSQTASAQVSGRFDARLNRQVTVTADAAASAPAGGTAGGLPGDVEQRVGRLSGVEAVGIVIDADIQPVAASLERGVHDLRLVGASDNLVRAVDGRVRWARGHGQHLAAGEIIVGTLAAQQMDLAPLELSPTLVVANSPFTVVGILEKAPRAPDLLSAVIAERDDAEGFGPAAGIEVYITTLPGAAPQVADQAPIALDPVAPERFDIDAPADPAALRAEIESDVRITMLVLSVVALLTSAAGIANAMTVGVVQRTSEFGLRRAIGARPKHILGQVTVEAAAIGALGGVAGLYLGMAGILVVTVIQRWQPVFDLRLVAVALVCGTAVGVLGGLAAAVRASRVQPVEALRA